ncbi:unnamed protein product [Darwinula stevensoni]|uniref:MutS-like protein n=1 Tax=Darwinula stevensoni TaxID=69355 RepID=A0A7R9A731_9CRUS|nr:unnamed protein product [Darwinula stevensoni]CAG0890009.1 unnamed protein product [Darwinula stevensoni]
MEKCRQKDRYYCLAAAGALLKYVEMIQNILFAPKSLKIVFQALDKTTYIDVGTGTQLELLRSTSDPAGSGSLLGVLGHTKTAGGARLLRANILQPPCDLPTIRDRLNVVQELSENPDLLFGLQARLMGVYLLSWEQSVLSRFIVDVDHLHSLCIQIPKQDTVLIAETRLNYIIGLKHVLELVEPLQRALLESELPYFRYIRQDSVQRMNMPLSVFLRHVKELSDERFGLMLREIGKVLRPDAFVHKGSVAMKTQRCFAVKSDINGLLDAARRTYSEVIDDITQYVDGLAGQTGLPLRVSHNATWGFHIQISDPDNKIAISTIPDIFISVQRQRSCILCSTEDLLLLDQRTKEAVEQIEVMSDLVVKELLKAIQGQISSLYKLSEATATLDMLQSLAHLRSISTDYTRPNFGDTTAIRGGRHPILDKLGPDPPIPNDIFLSKETTFLVVTGPNMSGKSTYLKQVALLQIMAQIGSFVPAEFATFRPADQILTRMGFQDNMEANASTFKLEVHSIGALQHD